MNEDNLSIQPFKTCGSCRRQWNRWQDFVLDTGVRLLGLQAITDMPDANLLVFEHRCGSSISVLANRLRHLLPVADVQNGLPKLFGTERCQRHCRLLADLEFCDQPCINARDRRLLLRLAEMKRG